MEQPNLKRLSVDRKIGSERFRDGATDLGFDLAEFWRWSVSDLVSNATRGILAEFIVARAIGMDSCCVRDEWGACDLIMAGDVKIEVKSTAYVQSWYQKRYSRTSFSIAKSRAWDRNTNETAAESRRQADVYVFAVLAHRDKATVDPLDMSQWRFYVVPTRALEARNQQSITLRSLEALVGESIPYGSLRSSLEAVVQGMRSTR